ncbi:hypothetical protein QN277_013876 [Acacia crassicarpa]|uniref:S-adenosyl-L-methionine-dependent methyltransferase n=1 Tax=Acacia crassicarpa TaxID=499986 RepID=A0AAE1N5P3_9FABA|nr:hypothetical protein QN277_013876 [Acacia crassicarpa]
MKLTHLQCFMDFAKPPAVDYMRPRLTYSFTRKVCVSAMKLNHDNDSLLFAAINSASLRYQESYRPHPLFVDPYADCLVPPNTSKDADQDFHPYCLATKFIDDKLLWAVSRIDGLKQVVLLTDGMDTRPYRLSWPPSTMIVDISPESVFQTAAEKLEGVGAKIPRSCVYLHVPMESSDLKQSLHFKGFNGSRPSVWITQGFPLMTLENFEDLLSIVSSLALKGCFFVGELPGWLAEKGTETKFSTGQWMDKLFMSNGFRVESISDEGIAENAGKEFAPRVSANMLFVAEQLRFSDDQMETWRREFQRVEDEGDEEGFEEL